MPWSRPTLTTLVTRIQADITSRLTGSAAILRRSVLYILARAFAGAVHILHGYLEFISFQIFVRTAEEDYLDGHGDTWGITRLAASFATGSIQVTGDNATIIPEDSIFVRDDGVEYISSGAAIIASGTADIPVTCRTEGDTGNSSTGSVFTLQSPIVGADDSVTVLTPGITGGTDQETDTDLRARISARIQNPPAGGSASDYITWAQSISGVSDAWVFENYSGAGTVSVAISATGVSPVPSGTLVTEVQTYIDTVRPVTAQVTVVAIDDAAIALTISISPNTPALQAAIEESLTEMLADDGEPGGSILLSHINEAILTSGLEDFEITSVFVDGAPAAIANINLTGFKYPVLGNTIFNSL